MSSEAAPPDPRGLGVSKAAWEQHRLGEAASLVRDRNLLGVKVQAIARGGQRLVFGSVRAFTIGVGIR